MKKIRINLAPHSVLRSLYCTSLWTWLLTALGIALCGCALVALLHQQLQLDQQLTRLHELDTTLARRRDIKPATKKSAITDAQAAVVNGAIAQLNLPWDEVFDALETATPPTIALLSLDPDARRNTVKVLAEAKDSDGMVHYIEQVKKQELFTSVIITMHDVNQLDPNKPMRFQFEASWRADPS